jgi:hypothetical protein
LRRKEEIMVYGKVIRKALEGLSARDRKRIARMSLRGIDPLYHDTRRKGATEYEHMWQTNSPIEARRYRKEAETWYWISNVIRAERIRAIRKELEI